MSVEISACADPSVVRRMAARAEAAADYMSDLVLREVPHYRTLTAEQFGDVRITLRDGFRATMALWHQGRLARGDELALFRANGATRAAEGRPLPSVLRAYRLGTLGAFEFVTRECGAQLDAAEIANLARLVLGFGDQLSNEVTLGYVGASEQLAAQEGRARRELFEDLLAGRFASTDSLRERAALLQVAIPKEPTVIVAAPGAPDERTLAERAQLLREALPTPDDPARPPLALISRGRAVLIVAEQRDDLLEAALAGAGLRAAAVTAGSIDDVSEAYACAAEVVDLVSEGRLPARTLTGDGEARLLYELVRSSRAGLAPAARQIVRPLAEAGPAFLDTLDAFFVSENAVAAAERLGIHPQTMRYRLRRIRELTGRDPAVGWDRFVLELALRGHQLARPTDASESSRL